MQYQCTEFPQRFSSLIILFIVIDLYFLFHRVLVKLLPGTTFQISVFPCQAELANRVWQLFYLNICF